MKDFWSAWSQHEIFSLISNFIVTVRHLALLSSNVTDIIWISFSSKSDGSDLAWMTLFPGWRNDPIDVDPSRCSYNEVNWMCKCMKHLQWRLYAVWNSPDCPAISILSQAMILRLWHHTRPHRANINHPNIPDDTQSVSAPFSPHTGLAGGTRILTRSDQSGAEKSVIVTALIDTDINTGL